MPEKITLKSNVELGVVPTHIKFVGGLVPDDEGRLPRSENGELIVVNEMKHLTEISPVKIVLFLLVHDRQNKLSDLLEFDNPHVLSLRLKQYRFS